MSTIAYSRRKLPPDCEHKRIMEISQDIMHRPIVFLGCNPDGYASGKGESVPSCWNTTPMQGIAVVKKSALKEWTMRLEGLYASIKHWAAAVPDKMHKIHKY